MSITACSRAPFYGLLAKPATKTATTTTHRRRHPETLETETETIVPPLIVQRQGSQADPEAS